MKLPKLYRVVNLEFWSLRSSVGYRGGVTFDNDEKVLRRARRVLIDGGWKWSIQQTEFQQEWDYMLQIDQSCLDNALEDISSVKWFFN